MNINLVAPINNLGYGLSGLNLFLEMSKEAEVALFPIGPLDYPEEHDSVVQRGRGGARQYDDSAPSIRVWHQDQMAEHVGRGRRVGFPFFELDPLLPHEVHHLNRMDAACVASSWAAGVAVRSGVTSDIHVVNLGVDRTVFHQDIDAGRLDDDTTVFFHVGKWELRKGHDLILSAFNKAFGRSDKVALRMMCENPFIGGGNDEWAIRYKTSKLGDKVELLARVRTQREVAAFMAAGDVGLFPARAEGWNLDLLEAMSCGKHVVATYCTAHTEYADANNAFLIDVPETEAAVDGVWFHGQGEWGHLGPAQEEQMVEHMRGLHRRKQCGELGVNWAGVATAKALTWESAASALIFAATC